MLFRAHRVAKGCYFTFWMWSVVCCMLFIWLLACKLRWMNLVLLLVKRVVIYRSHIYWSSSQVFTWPHPLAFLCHLSSSATLTWPPRSLCPASEDFYGLDTSLCNHWPFALDLAPSFYSIHFINWCVRCVFSFSQDSFLLSGSLALEALLIGVHCKKRYINI